MPIQSGIHLNSIFLLTVIATWGIAEPLRADQIVNTPIKLSENLEVSIEIARTRAERERGLMYKTSLGEMQGMLFVYPDEQPRKVWMKNTLIPLDVLFLAADGRIVSVLENLPPCIEEPCQIYNSEISAKYMLEFNADFFNLHNLKIGQQLQLP